MLLLFSGGGVSLPSTKNFLNRCIWNATSNGTVDFVVASAASNGYTPAQCLDPLVASGVTYHYFAINNTEHEEGDGTYDTVTNTLTRTTIRNSSNSGSKVNFTNPPVVFMGGPVAHDMDMELIANTTFYVSTTGNDSNNGLSVGQAWLTLQHAVDVLSGIELAGFTATIQIADGTYAGAVLSVPNLSGFIKFNGNAATPANVVIGASTSIVSQCLTFNADMNIIVTNLKIQGGTFVGYGLISGSDFMVHVVVGNVIFTGEMAHCFFCDTGSIWEVSDITIDTVTGCNSVFELDNAHVSWEGTWTISGTPAWSDAFVECYNNAVFHRPGIGTITGSATGRRFNVSNGGVIYTGTNNLTLFPGNVAGTILSGGQYDVYGPRIILTANGNYYVSSTGSDTTGDGSVAAPWATIQHAWDYLKLHVDGGGFTININIAAGTFAGASLVDNPPNTVYVGLIGAGIDTTTITSNDGGYSVFDLNAVTAAFSEMTLEMSSAASFGGHGLVADGSVVNVAAGNIKFNGVGTASSIGSCFAYNCPGAIYAAGYDNITDVPIYITGNWANLVRCAPNSNMNYIEFDSSINFVSTPDFSDAVFRMLQGTNLNFNTLSFSGAFTGKQFVWDGFANLSGTTIPGLIAAMGGGTAGTLENGLEYASLVKSGAPTTSDLAPGAWSVFKDSLGGGVVIAYNDGGTIKMATLTT